MADSSGSVLVLVILLLAIVVLGYRLRRALAKAQRRTDQFLILNEVGYAVSTLHDLPQVLETIYRQVQRSLHTDAFFLCLYDATTNEVSFPITYDQGQRWEEPGGLLDPDTYVSRIIHAGQPIMIHRTAAELRQPVQSERMVGNKTRKSASIMFAPLFMGERVIGVVSVQSYTLNAYTQDDLALLVGIGHHAAIAIENARLYAAMQQELQERQRAEEALRALNAELETRVVERTAELEASNRELEAFAYSASHDLRTPLHIISGFSRILAEEYRTHLSDEALDYLHRIQLNTRRMNTLIDQLLSFSRYGSYALALRPLEPERIMVLVQQVVEEIQATAPERTVEWQIHPLDGCIADPVLLRQIWLNLLGNAFKYTRGRTPAVIQVGMDSSAEPAAYMVRDNGVGFDLGKAEKLFGVFQRLHPSDVFEGSGIGLALVKRIVDRHGGRIWAEAAPNQGATFFFSLPGTNGSGERLMLDTDVHDTIRP